jgi:hypothetical protein
VIEQFENYSKVNRKLPAETAVQLGQIEEPSKLADAVAANVNIKVSDKQALLAELDPVRRLEMAFAFMEGELGVMQVEKKIRSRVKRQMEKTQREYYLNEQLKAIQRELGNEGEEGGGDELAELARKIERTKLSRKRAARPIRSSRSCAAMAPMSAEATVSRNYLDVLLGLPWGKKSKLKHDIAEAERILDEDHYGLEKVKEPDRRISRGPGRTNKLKGPILCLVGPPGVGKTSLGRSIARATGREFVASRWRRPRRGRDPRPPPHLYRLAARQDRHQPEEGRALQPALPARRDRQARPGFPRRSRLGPARGARSRSRTAASRTIIWRSTTTFRTSCSSPPRTRWTCRSPCSTAWRSSASKAIPRTRRWRSPSAT